VVEPTQFAKSAQVKLGIISPSENQISLRSPPPSYWLDLDKPSSFIVEERKKTFPFLHLGSVIKKKKKTKHAPGDSSRDLFHPQTLEVTNNH